MFELHGEEPRQHVEAEFAYFQESYQEHDSYAQTFQGRGLRYLLHRTTLSCSSVERMQIGNNKGCQDLRRN